MSVPEKQLWRRGEVMAFLGLNSPQVTALIAAGSLVPFYVRKQGRALYKRENVMELVKGKQQQGSTESRPTKNNH